MSADVDAFACVHRENKPPIDLAPVARRIKERRSYVANYRDRGVLRWQDEIVTADTDMLEAVMLECSRLRAANAALHEVVASLSPRPVA